MCALAPIILCTSEGFSISMPATVPIYLLCMHAWRAP